ncbi:MAG: hypothetical protein CMD38_00270 [Flavobacteriales bacterium]|nr:hypothetical protein [Flavobacteriales bacterium]|tara:strand:- start:505 stop:1008 length:504 start_codon:yes stop_codon:yes gene_type:complete
MKKAIYLLTLILFVFACNTEVSVDVSNDTISKIFEKNCETVISYEKAFCEENIDYKKFYSDKAIIKGTILGDKDSLYVADRMIAHQELWQKYDFSMSPLNPLPGVNLETKKLDGSVRMYFDITITLTENGKSVTIPMYNSFDFDDEGKIIYLQYYGDFTAAFLSLEE